MKHQINLATSRAFKRGFGNATVVALALLATTAAYGQRNIRVTVDGDPVSFNGAMPHMQGSRVMVPLRGVFEKMGADVRWDRNNQTVYATRGSDEITLPIGSRTATVNGNRVQMDTPAHVMNGRAMVPLRFLSESLSADVNWNQGNRLVAIVTNGQGSDPQAYTMVTLQEGSVIPFRMDQEISSRTAEVGDKFKARLDTSDFDNYSGMSEGAILEGHVETVRARDNEAAGVLGLAFDRIRTADGRVYTIDGTLIGLDSKSIKNENGRLMATSAGKKDNLKWVGYGAGAGALVSLVANTNFLTSTVIGAALGFLFGEVQKDNTRDVVLKEDTKFGVRLTESLSFRMPTQNQ